MMTTVPVEVPPLISMTADLLGGDPALKDVDIRVEGGSLPVVGDPELLKIVFQNLLVNSAQAMRGRGRIQVSIATIDSLCRISFADDGPGIPPEVRERIFVPFFTTKSRGTGLGLPTAKRLVEAHQGSIRVECPTGGGTVVTIHLPLFTSGAARA